MCYMCTHAIYHTLCTFYTTCYILCVPCYTCYTPRVLPATPYGHWLVESILPGGGTNGEAGYALSSSELPLLPTVVAASRPSTGPEPFRGRAGGLCC